LSTVPSNYSDLLRSETPFIDVRSPSEFKRGSLPNTVNLPLLTDDERTQIGLCYKRDGREKAIALGNELVSGEKKAIRIASWVGFVEAHKKAAVYCWRGGLRSEIVQRWLAAEGHNTHRIEGGFRALRRVCLRTLETSQNWIVLAGRTGCGKTQILSHVPRAIDLEALANHRGSAFGKNDTSQPCPIDFENTLAVELLKLGRLKPIAIEDESRTIGRLAIPESIFISMRQAPVVLVEANKETRIANIYKEYVLNAVNPQAKLENSLDSIKRRLGSERHKTIQAQIRKAFSDTDQAAHYDWIRKLLQWYYDPMYDYQVEQKQSRIEFSGDSEAVIKFLKSATK